MNRAVATVLAALLMAASAAACAPRPPAAAQTAPSAPPAAQPVPSAPPASQSAQPLPPASPPASTGSATSAAAPSAPSLACRTDADCAVKDVGSCCGYRPACVSAVAETFPDEVRARCAAQDRVGICGFPAISGCQCVSGRCAAAADAQGPASPAPLQ